MLSVRQFWVPVMVGVVTAWWLWGVVDSWRGVPAWPSLGKHVAALVVFLVGAGVIVFVRWVRDG